MSYQSLKICHKISFDFNYFFKMIPTLLPIKITLLNHYINLDKITYRKSNGCNKIKQLVELYSDKAFEWVVD